MPKRYWIAAVLPAASCFVPAGAVELGVSAGISDAAASGSYSWQMEYRQRLAEDYGLSFQYPNEGHLPGHHRDGGALEAWADARRSRPEQTVPVMRNELGALFGQTVLNSCSSPKSPSFGLEYRRGLTQHPSSPARGSAKAIPRVAAVTAGS
ncbi:MAG: hypothetical protein ACYDAE_12610 [Steroidobacteraceae bacterium]